MNEMNEVDRFVADVKAYLWSWYEACDFHTHPASVDESYWEHAWHAMRLSTKAMTASIVFAVHAVFPMLFCRTGTDLMIDLYKESLGRRGDCSSAAAASAAEIELEDFPAFGGAGAVVESEDVTTTNAPEKNLVVCSDESTFTHNGSEGV